jgi:hypothetical protein
MTIFIVAAIVLILAVRARRTLALAPVRRR